VAGSVPAVIFVSNSQVIGCEDCLRNDLYCVKWGVKLYSIQSNPAVINIESLLSPSWWLPGWPWVFYLYVSIGKVPLFAAIKAWSQSIA